MFVAVAPGADLKADLSATTNGIQQNKDLGNVVGGETYQFSADVYFQGGPSSVTSVTFGHDGNLPSFVTSVTGGTLTRSSGTGESTHASSTITVLAPCTLGVFGGTSGGATKVSGAAVQYVDSPDNASVGVGTAFINITGNVTSLGSNCNVTPPDSTPPVITPSISGTLGNNGWYVSDVSLSWSVVDSESAISSSSGCDAVSIIADQDATTYTCSATSAGGTASESVSIKRDATAPSVSCGAADGNWHASDVSIACTASDVRSGLVDAADANFSLATSVAIGTEKSDASTGSRTISDQAGNSSPAGPVAGNKIDKKGPSVTLNGAADSCSLPGNNGWCRGTQTAGFSASDGGSGLATDGAASRNFTKQSATNGSAVMIASGAVADMVGNSNAGIDAGPYMIDSGAPSVSCQSPPAFLLNQPGAQVSASISDAISLPLNASESAAADTSSVGLKNVSITGYDNAGNSATKSCAYTVGYNFDGLYAPVDRPNTLNVSKAGQAIPLKWRLTDYFGNGVTSLSSASVVVGSLACSASVPSDLIEEYAAGSSGLQNLGDGYYQFNWKTPSTYANSCKAIGLNLGEAAPRYGLGNFNFKK